MAWPGHVLQGGTSPPGHFQPSLALVWGSSLPRSLWLFETPLCLTHHTGPGGPYQRHLNPQQLSLGRWIQTQILNGLCPASFVSLVQHTWKYELISRAWSLLLQQLSYLIQVFRTRDPSKCSRKPALKVWVRDPSSRVIQALNPSFTLRLWLKFENDRKKIWIKPRNSNIPIKITFFFNKSEEM